jgi:hypothetical protein
MLRRPRDRPDRETAAAAKERALELDAAEIRQRLAELGQQVRKAAEQTTTADGSRESAAPGRDAPGRDAPSSPILESLRKYAGTKAAVSVLDQVPEPKPVQVALVSPDRLCCDGLPSRKRPPIQPVSRYSGIRQRYW